MPKKIPPILETIGRQFAIGLGQVATRAVAHAGKSVAKDIRAAGEEIQRRAKHVEKKIDAMINPEDEDEQ